MNLPSIILLILILLWFIIACRHLHRSKGCSCTSSSCKECNGHCTGCSKTLP